MRTAIIYFNYFVNVFKVNSFIYLFILFSRHPTSFRLFPQVVPSYLWMANSSAKAAMDFSPPDRFSMDMKRFPGATQL